MSEAKNKMDRRHVLESACLQNMSLDADGVRHFIETGDLSGGGLTPPTAAEIALLNKSYGG